MEVKAWRCAAEFISGLMARTVGNVKDLVESETWKLPTYGDPSGPPGAWEGHPPRPGFLRPARAR